MSDYIFPTFQGWSYEKTITPEWNTTVYESESGRETRIQKWKYPRYTINITFNFLTDNTTKGTRLEKGDIETLEGFYNRVGGSFDDFLYYDDTENSVENQAFGAGDGTTTEFQLIRSQGYWTEPVYGIVETPSIYIDDDVCDDFSVDTSGLVTFKTAPSSGSVLYWTGNYYFRVRFSDDEIELSRTWDGLWESLEVEMKTVKP